MSGYEPFPTDAHSNRAASTVDPRLGGRWRRFWALMLDWLIIFVLDFLAAVVVSVAFGDLDDTAATATWYGVSIVIALLYFPLLLRRRGAHNGQTWGKQALGVRVVTKEGIPVTFWRAARREWLGVQLLVTITSGLYALVDYPVGLFTDRRQTLHDRIGGTFVFRADVEVRAAVEQEPLLPHDASPFESDQRDAVNRAFGR